MPSPCKRVPCVASGHTAGHQTHEVEGVDFGFQPPCQAGPGPERPNQSSRRLVEAGTLGVPLAAHPVVPAFHKVPQLDPYRRCQAHPALHHRPTVRCLGTAHGCRSRPVCFRAGP